MLHRDPVDHDHFRAPTILPVLGVVLWFVNRAAGGGPDGLRAENLAG